MPCKQEVDQALRNLSPPDYVLCWDEVQHDISLESEKRKTEKKKTQENSIKLLLEASDKFMEIKVLCKSVVCLAMFQITRGCTILHSN